MIINNTVSESILIRLLRIIAQFFFKSVRFLPTNYKIIDALVQNAEKPVVLNLLDSLISAEKTNTDSLIYLHKENLHKKIYQELGELVNSPSDSNHPFLFGPVDSKRYAFYQLITKMARSATLGQIYRHEKFLDVIFRQPDILPNYIKNYKWYAICSTYKPNMIQNAIPIIEKSIEIIQSIYLSDRFHSFFAYAFSFFNQNLMTFPQLVLSLIENPELFLEKIMKGVLKFRSCTNMHYHFRKFYEIMLNFKKFSIYLVNNYVPVFIRISSVQKNRILAASFNELLLKTIEMARSKSYLKEELRKIPEFPVYATTKLREYKDAVSDNYGEEPPNKIYQFIAKFFQ
ncbi:hypothetical protein TVAG_266810 [Trichomonas vaginalis G3]|uniref:Uncharacterized protein n=1 Tax=Trichomonas vaginalis (strain ATCC PRA-98 / G3) TaxID=412133 RepID=A2DQN4_TRIV3|nr:hypothetical protein TVAGG3_0480470 [Trichomonas vaginalis G3]EAY17318.1 hypothetical protein TVAG_266810 [Trichomonas vaginalis G3]KAI5515669.1 hypothetical protein TVAGG3_0480470 [Trichomonas vaginalis G3]|eukprot:XP_001329541.1 hypothetical protein [Trichomonas vaginalis G3]